MNDAIVNFAIVHLFLNIENEIKLKIHIFDTHFYDRLILTKNILHESDDKHKNVARWTKNTDIFKKEMIVIPVCQEQHWFIVLVINPGVITVTICGF